jgi:hypothetical protein
MNRLVLVLTVAVVMLLSAAGGVAVAQLTLLRGDQFREVAVVQVANDTYTYSENWRDIPGASVTITNNTLDDELVLARFNGQSLCHGGYGGGHCFVRIVTETPTGVQKPMPPQFGERGSAFDSSANGDWEMHSMDRAADLEGGSLTTPATYTVKAQWRHSGAATVCGGFGCDDRPFFGLDDYSLTVERLKLLRVR